VRVDYLEAPKDFLVDRQVKAQVLVHRCFLFHSPVLNGACILLHDYVIASLINSIVVEVGHTRLESKLL